MAGGKFGGGNGTPESPFLVEDIADLKAISGTNIEGSSAKKYYLQTADLDLSAEGSDFQCIIIKCGNVSSSSFCYDGGGHKILNLTQIQSDGSSSSDFGLFELYNSSSYSSTGRDFSSKFKFVNMNLINVNVTGRGGSPILKPLNFSYGSSSNYSAMYDVTFENCFVSGKMSLTTDTKSDISCFMSGKGIRKNTNHNIWCYPTIKGCVAVMQVNISASGGPSDKVSFGGFIGDTQYDTSATGQIKMLEICVVNSALHLDIHAENTGSGIVSVAGMVNGSCSSMTTSYVNASYDTLNTGEGVVNSYYFTPKEGQVGSCIANHEKGQLENYAYDSVHLLTDEQMKDSAYYERLGWWI